MKLKLPMFSKDSLKESSGWIAFIIGLICYVFGNIIIYFQSDIAQLWVKCAFWANLFVSIGDILLIGGVVVFLTSVAQWKGVFTEELTNVVYGKELLSKRIDLKTIWENTTKQMFKYKFHRIHREILDTMSHYLPNENEISYYDNFIEDISVRWLDREKGIVQTTEVMSFDIIAESEAVLNYPVFSKTTISPEIGKPEECVKHTIFLDGSEFIKAETKHRRCGEDVIMETSIPLGGAKKYHFKFIIDKKYDLNKDFTICYGAQRYVHTMRISLLLDDGISAEFIDRGEFEPFKEIKKSKHNIIIAHSGVILPKQGFMFALKID